MRWLEVLWPKHFSLPGIRAGADLEDCTAAERRVTHTTEMT